MAKYLVACSCGRQHTVETRQAGETIACECGATVAVPTLRQLRLLPEAGDETASEKKSTAAAAAPSWGVRQRVITLCLLAAAACLAIAGVSRSLEQPLPEIDSVAYTKNVDRMVGAMTPLAAWQRWHDTYEPLRSTGFEVYKHPAEAAMKQALTWHHGVQVASLGLAALLGVVAVAAWLSKSGK
jgi:hypothetical protein